MVFQPKCHNSQPPNNNMDKKPQMGDPTLTPITLRTAHNDFPKSAILNKKCGHLHPSHSDIKQTTYL